MTVTAPEITDVDLDALLLDSAASEKVQQVEGVTGGALQSRSARAWTMGGQVD